MKAKEITKYCLDAIKLKSIEKGECTLVLKEMYELNINHGEVTLLRTTKDKSLKIRIIKDNKEAQISVNKTNPDDIDKAIVNAIDLCESAQADEAYNISEFQEHQEFLSGNKKPELEKMFDSVEEFCEDVKRDYQQIKFEEGTYTFEYVEKYYVNTNGVDLVSKQGVYQQVAMITAKEGKNTSSFNYTYMQMKDVKDKLIEQGTLKYIMDCAIQELHAKSFDDKFEGDIIITSDALGTFIHYYLYTFLSGQSLITGTSKLKDKLNEQVASDKLTIKSLPFSEEIVGGKLITGDGYVAEDMTIIDEGVLKTFLLDIYSANKTGFDRAKNDGDNIVVVPGDKTIDQIIKDTKRGLVIGRFSGGNPNANGDFSGVAKNSFYVENGEIKQAITETMISGNLIDMFNNIVDVSKETVNFGASIVPWIKCTGVIVSGKV